MVTKEDLKFADKKGKKAFAQTIVNNSGCHLHKINGYLIARQIDFIARVDLLSLELRVFNSEEDALNNCLDLSLQNRSVQGELFNDKNSNAPNGETMNKAVLEGLMIKEILTKKKAYIESLPMRFMFNKLNDTMTRQFDSNELQNISKFDYMINLRTNQIKRFYSNE